MAIEKKVRVGVSFDHALADHVERAASQLKELGVDRSEVVNAILAEFFEAGGCTTESGWEGVSGRWTMRRAS